MKKRIATAALALIMALGITQPVLAYSGTAVISEAKDASGNPVTATFTLEDMDYDMTDKFYEVTENEQKEVSDYFGTRGLAGCPYANGPLDLSQTGASAENPVSVTFTMKAQYDDWPDPMAGQRWVYVLQQFDDGSYKLLPAQVPVDNTATVQFTDAVNCRILIMGLDLGREGLIYDYVEDMTEVAGVQSAQDSQGNPVNVTVAAFDVDQKAVAATEAYELCNGHVAIAAANVSGSASADNPVTVTFSIPGVKKGDSISVIHRKADGDWEVLPGTCGDGTVTATFTSFSPVAFVDMSKALDGDTTPDETPGTTTPTDTTTPSGTTTPTDTTTPSGTTTPTDTTTPAQTPAAATPEQKPAATGTGNTQGKPKASPKTGEDMTLDPVMGVLAVSMLSLTALAVYGKKRKAM